LRAVEQDLGSGGVSGFNDLPCGRDGAESIGDLSERNQLGLRAEEFAILAEEDLAVVVDGMIRSLAPFSSARRCQGTMLA